MVTSPPAHGPSGFRYGMCRGVVCSNLLDFLSAVDTLSFRGANRSDIGIHRENVKGLRLGNGKNQQKI
jgi:hypothetical protein